MTQRITEERDDMFPRTYRHWHAASEYYTGGDALLTALEEGWQMPSVVYRQDHLLAGVRTVSVYHIDLTRADIATTMRVIVNPFIAKLLQTREARIVTFDGQRQRAE